MRGLFAKLENPAVTGLTAKFSDAKADMTPAAIPDLYRGEPLVLAARLDKLAGSVEIKGRIGDRPWTVTLPLANAAEGKGLSKLWARRKIADAEIARTMRQATPEEADKTILALALEHQLVTRLTSLVAVDKTPSRPEGEPLKVTELPLNLPAGWEFAKVFGERPRPLSPPTERRADAGTPTFSWRMPSARCPGRADARHGHAAEDGNRRRTEDDRWLGPAGARPDPARVQPASDVRLLTPDDRRSSSPPSSLKRARPPPPGPRAQFSPSLRAQAKQTSMQRSKSWIASSIRSRNDGI